MQPKRLALIESGYSIYYVYTYAFDVQKRADFKTLDHFFFYVNMRFA